VGNFLLDFWWWLTDLARAAYYIAVGTAALWIAWNFDQWSALYVPNLRSFIGG